jgi:hypothetical protein
VWGQDLLGPFKKAPGGLTHLIIVVDKFTKWIQVRPLACHPHLGLSKRDRRLPPMQQGHICMEPSRNAGRLLGSHEARPQH